jgi:predicted Na+-dependent transporter
MLNLPKANLVAALRCAVVTATLALCVTPAFSQCQMCYESAKGAPKDGQRALSRAILVLLVPPLGAMTLGVGCAFRYGKRRDQEKNDSDDSSRPAD